jgi:4-amino-4-deoxy-L-arabinose transferase-like glycosyltransferase
MANALMRGSSPISPALAPKSYFPFSFLLFPPRSSQHRLWGLIAVSSLLRLALAVRLGPSNDEAYHAQFVLHPDWSYFDHPPMVAVVAAAGLAMTGGAMSPLALRVGFIALFAGSTWLMARFAGRLYGPRAGLLAAFALNVSGDFGAVASTFALPDGPLLFFWLATLDRLALAVQEPDRLGRWILVGLAWGGALLSKYHAVFLPAGVLLYLAIEPSARPLGRKPGPYLALALGMVLFAPVLAWNARHGWASLAFQGRRALGPLRFRPETLLVALAGQAAYLFPWIWLGLIRIVVVRLASAIRSGSTRFTGIPAPLSPWGEGLGCGGVTGPSPPHPGPSPQRGWEQNGDAQREHLGDWFLIGQAVWPLAVFSAVACVRPVFPHWSLIGFVALFPLLGRAWADRLATDPRRMKRRLMLLALLPVALVGAISEQARSGWLQKDGHGPLGLIPAAIDPTLELFGWDQVARELERRGLLDQPETFLFTGHWYLSGQLAFAIHQRSPVLCYRAGDARGFAFWSRPEEWVGRDGILVALDHRSTEPACFERWFTRIEPLGQFPILRAGVPVRTVRLFRCVCQIRPFPFDARHKPAAATAIRGGTVME